MRQKFDMWRVFTARSFKSVICNADVIIETSLKYPISHGVWNGISSTAVFYRITFNAAL